VSVDDLPLRPDPEPVSTKTPPPQTKVPPKASRKRRGWYVASLALLPLSAIAGAALASFISMPEVAELESYQPGLITTLADRDGVRFESYARERRVLLTEGELPEVLKQAIVAVEDAHFYRHGGVDLLGVMGAAIDNLKAGRIVRGAGTLTMQLARELFLTRERDFSRKASEALLAVEIEKRYSKEQILTLYANLVNVGHGHYGMEAGARYYFNKSVGDLTLAEAATLAGIPQRPADYSPYRNPDLVTKRRNKVLRRMFEENFIDQATYDAAVAEPLLVAQRTASKDRPVGAYFAEEVRRHLERSYGADVLYDQGLQVETTLDRRIQESAELALRDGLVRLDQRRGWRGPTQKLPETIDPDTTRLPSWTPGALEVGAWYEGVVTKVDAASATIRIGDETVELDKSGIAWTRKSSVKDVLARGDVAWFRLLPHPKDEAAPPVLTLAQEPELEGAAIVLESATGAVRGMVGGFDFEKSKFNRATQAARQVGSAFKPFVFASAFENGYTAADTIFDAPVAFAGADAKASYSPRNYYRRYYGIITLRRSLELSVNVAAVKLQDLVGVDAVIDVARRCGITANLPAFPSLALGASDIVPMELATAYAAIANLGVRVEPWFVERVTTPDGRVLERHSPRAAKALDPPVAYVLTRVLQGVTQRGTAGSLRRLELDLAGKTGTTNDYSDAWFVGFTPKYTILTWVGYDRKRSLGRGMTGAEAALPIWTELVEAGLEQGWIAKGEQFSRPAGVTEVTIEADTGLLPGESSAQLLRESFVAGTEPSQISTEQWRRIMSLPWFQQRPFYLPKENERMPEDIEDWSLIRAAWADR
jgi:penicillin-binding protein 1A